MTERPIGVDPKEAAVLQETCSELFRLYSSTYSFGRRVNVELIPPIEEARSYISDNIDMNIPRGAYTLAVGFLGIPGKDIITGVQFFGEKVKVVIGNPALVDPQNPDQVFRTILAHELIHSQITPRPVIGINPPPLAPRDIRFGGEIHYVLGFKAVSTNPKINSRQEPSKLLDEYVTQYLAMNMTGAFERKNPVLEKIKIHGLGMNPEYIEGAELINQAFLKRGIAPQMVETFHHESDIKGFLAMLSRIDPEFSRNILRAGVDSNSRTSIDKLKQIQ